MRAGTSETSGTGGTGETSETGGGMRRLGVLGVVSG